MPGQNFQEEKQVISPYQEVLRKFPYLEKSGTYKTIPCKVTFHDQGLDRQLRPSDNRHWVVRDFDRGY